MRAGILDSVRHGLEREVVVGRRAVAGIAVATTVVCLTLGAYARVYLPFTPVPITLQTFFVLVAAASLGPGLATASLSAYLLVGAIGLPVFTGLWLGPTTGYLVGFVAGGWLTAKLTRRTESVSAVGLVLAMGAGLAVVYACGVAYLAWALGIGLGRAVALGLVPFLPGAVVKLAAAAAFVRGYQTRLRALFP